ncbi:MAG: hypothetical protein JW818_19900 [Pirellulales bacterium]|nr:hypothetical protein [Pirellulales bacterium]
MPDDFDPYYTWLGIPPSHQPPDHYRLLGIQSGESNPAVIENAADRQMAHLRTFQTGRHSEASQRLLNEVAAAKLCLLDPMKKIAYDEALRRAAAKEAMTTTSSGNGVFRSPVFVGAAVGGVLLVVAVVAISLLVSPQQPEGPVAASGQPAGGSPTAPKTVLKATPTKRPEKHSSPTPFANEPTKPVTVAPPAPQPGPGETNPKVPPNQPEPQQPAVSQPNEPIKQPPDPSPPTVDPATPSPSPIGKSPTPEPASSGLPKPGPTPEPAPDPAGRRLVPDAATLAPIVQQVEEKFQLKSTQDPAKSISTTTRLFDATRAEGTSPEEKYVLLTTAEQLARQAGDAVLMLEAVTTLGDEFAVDTLALKEQALGKFAAVATGNETIESLVRAADAAIDEAVAQERFNLALSMAEHAARGARKSVGSSLVKHVSRRKKTLEKLAQEHRQVEEALVVLKSRPEDPAANGLLGRWYCFEKDDWARGLPYLAKSDDDRLKATSQLELENPPLSWKDQVALADRWWMIADTARGHTRDRLQAHAASWYEKAAPGAAGSPQYKRLVRRLRGFAARTAEQDDGLPSDSAPLACRQPRHRAALLARYGGTAESEKAVQAALKWIVSVQFPDGGWSFAHQKHSSRGGNGLNPGKEVKAWNAATGLALLALMGSGNTHRSGEYRNSVEAGLRFLTRLRMKIDPNGGGGSLREEQGTMYSHGLGTMALCEAYAMTGDANLDLAVRQAVRYTCYAQDPQGGGWRYKPRERGDTSVTGWQLSSLHTAQLAGLKIPPLVTTQAGRFLDKVQFDGGSRYGYERADGGSTATTAVGLLCRMYLGWKRDNPALVKGVKWIHKQGVSDKDIYGNYYATQLLFHYGGEAWDDWNPAMRDLLLRSQEMNGLEKGSWYFPGVSYNERGGRLYCTALSVLILETYYRYDPLDVN